MIVSWTSIECLCPYYFLNSFILNILLVTGGLLPVSIYIHGLNGRKKEAIHYVIVPRIHTTFIGAGTDRHKEACACTNQKRAACSYPNGTYTGSP